VPRPLAAVARPPGHGPHCTGTQGGLRSLRGLLRPRWPAIPAAAPPPPSAPKRQSLAGPSRTPLRVRARLPGQMLCGTTLSLAGSFCDQDTTLPGDCCQSSNFIETRSKQHSANQHDASKRTQMMQCSCTIQVLSWSGDVDVAAAQAAHEEGAANAQVATGTGSPRFGAQGQPMHSQAMRKQTEHNGMGLQPEAAWVQATTADNAL